MVPRCHRVLTEHSRHFGEFSLVYPVISRRSGGLSIGINLNPDGACNFDCVYCQVDLETTTPGRRAQLDTIRDELSAMLAMVTDGAIWQHERFAATPRHLRRLSDIAFSGDGEPTAHPRFAEAVGATADVRDAVGLTDVPLVLMTNATRLTEPVVRDGLAHLSARGGEVWAKLDAGTEADLQRIDRPKSGVTLARIVDNILSAGLTAPLVIQSMFLREHGNPPSESQVDAYLTQIASLIERGCRIKAVQLYTVARQPRAGHVTPLTLAELELIADRLRALGLSAHCYA